MENTNIGMNSISSKDQTLTLVFKDGRENAVLKTKHDLYLLYNDYASIYDDEPNPEIVDIDVIEEIRDGYSEVFEVLKGNTLPIDIFEKYAINVLNKDLDENLNPIYPHVFKKGDLVKIIDPTGKKTKGTWHGHRATIERILNVSQDTISDFDFMVKVKLSDKINDFRRVIVKVEEIEFIKEN